MADPEAMNPGTEDSDADANLVIEDSAAAFASIMQPLMESMTAAIATAITNASTNAANIAAVAATAVQNMPKAIASISSLIDPFENLSTDMKFEGGKGALVHHHKDARRLAQSRGRCYHGERGSPSRPD